MSMINELVKNLRAYANVSLYAREIKAKELMREAADTIESLSAKMSAANMDRSKKYYNDRWIPCKERLPSKKECGDYRGYFIVSVIANKPTTMYMEYEYTTLRGKEVGRWIWNDRVNIPWEVIAWQPLPDPYHEP